MCSLCPDTKKQLTETEKRILLQKVGRSLAEKGCDKAHLNGLINYILGLEEEVKDEPGNKFGYDWETNYRTNRDQ